MLPIQTRVALDFFCFRRRARGASCQPILGATSPPSNPFQALNALVPPEAAAIADRADLAASTNHTQRPLRHDRSSCGYTHRSSSSSSSSNRSNSSSDSENRRRLKGGVSAEQRMRAAVEALLCAQDTLRHSRPSTVEVRAAAVAKAATGADADAEEVAVMASQLGPWQRPHASSLAADLAASGPEAWAPAWGLSPLASPGAGPNSGCAL